MNKSITLIFLVIFLTSLSSAATIKVIQSPIISPGGEGVVSLEIENNLQDQMESVSLILHFENLPFIPLGSSEESIDEIDEDDEERFNFRIKASNDISPGDYAIPYTLNYEFRSQERTKKGSFGIKVKANPDLSFSLSADNPVLNKKGELFVKVINKGFFDARFVSIKAIPNGLTLLSEDEVYIGDVDSDDFETVSFDVLFNSQSPVLNIIVEYKDFDNELIKKSASLPVIVYTEERAIEFGITQKNMTTTYLLIFIILIVVFLFYRFLRRRSRMRKSRGG